MADKRVILDLCGGTGAWSYFYRTAVGYPYDVDVVTLPRDVREYEPPADVWGVMCAPPCTYFSRARLISKGVPSHKDLAESLEIVAACLRIIARSKPVWWCLENPATGSLPEYLGAPVATFDPWQYGDPWTKETALWGYFNMPTPTVTVKPTLVKHRDNQPSTTIRQNAPHYSHVKLPLTRAAFRAVTPKGFASEFAKANP